MEIMGDWNSNTYIASQIFMAIAYILLAATYFITTRWKQLATIMTSNVNMGIGFALLGGWVGVGMVIVALTRDTVSSIINKRREKLSKSAQMKNTRADFMWLAVWITGITVATAITYAGPWSLTAYFATFAFTISIWQKNPYIYRLLGILVGVLWIIYNVMLQSLFGTVLESILLLFIIAGLIMFIKNNKKPTAKKKIK